jgi:hypothetical protein
VNIGDKNGFAQQEITPHSFAAILINLGYRFETKKILKIRILILWRVDVEPKIPGILKPSVSYMGFRLFNSNKYDTKIYS